jgi:hypothetical protein
MARFNDDETLGRAITELEQKLVDLQMNMVDLRLTGEGQDGVRFEARLLQKLSYLPRAVSVSDFPPTDQDLEVKTILADQLQDHLDALEVLVSGDVAALNRMLSARGLLIITDR